MPLLDNLEMQYDPTEIAPELARSGDGFTAGKFERLRRLIKETRARKTETLRLYKPLVPQEEFHRSMAWERILRGSNRGGKTTPALMEVAWAATGTHPYINYPKRGMRIFLVGKDQKHIATVFYQKLFRWGAIRMIRNLQTGLFDAVDPNNPEHKAREAEWEPSPPMIPKRLIKDISWESKKDNIWSKCTLYNDNEILAFPSGGEPPNGVDVDLVLMDEEIIHRGWYPEMSMRLLDRKGRFVWSATPQNGNEQLWDLSKEAEECKGQPEPRVEEFYMSLAENPHIDQRQKEVAAEKFKNNPEEYRVRILGEFAIASFKVYPSYNKQVHEFDLHQIGGQVPRDWTRYLAIDPSVKRAGGLFGACPPPTSEAYRKHGIRILIYDEVVVSECDAKKYVAAVEDKLTGWQFQRFIMDAHGAKPRSAGSGKSTVSYYRDQFEIKNYRSIETDSSFRWGSDNIMGRVQAVRVMLSIQNGQPGLRIAKGCCPIFEYEIGRYLRKRNNGFVAEEPDYRKDADLMACLEYLVADDPQWVEPPPLQAQPGRAYSAFKEWQARAASRKQDQPFINLGPGPGGVRAA